MNRSKLIIRRAVSALVRWILRAKSQPFPIEAGAITLILAPHQDDECLGCGGVIPLLLQAGHQVHVTYVTDGANSHPGHPALAALRKSEATAATELLGVPPTHLEFLGARDGALSALSTDDSAVLANQLTATLLRVRPTLVLLPCRSDGSNEHDASFRYFSEALATTTLRPRILEFPIWSWWNPRLLRQPLRQSRGVWRATFPKYAAQKRRTLSLYTTQVKSLAPGQGPLLTPEFLSFFTTTEEFFFEA